MSHFDQDRSEQYARAFRFVTTERELQWKLQDEYADVMSARFGSNAASRPGLLAALERYRQTGQKAGDAADAYLDLAAKLGARPTAEAKDTGSGDDSPMLGGVRLRSAPHHDG